MATLLQVGNLHHANRMCPAQIPGAARHGPAGVGLGPTAGVGLLCCRCCSVLPQTEQSTLRRLLWFISGMVYCIISIDLRSPSFLC